MRWRGLGITHELGNTAHFGHIVHPKENKQPAVVRNIEKIFSVSQLTQEVCLYHSHQSRRKFTSGKLKRYILCLLYLLILMIRNYLTILMVFSNFAVLQLNPTAEAKMERKVCFFSQKSRQSCKASQL